jgi:hypothetical protein
VGVVVFVATLTAISACLAADTGFAPGRGSIGGQLGGALIAADADYSEGAAPRFGFAATFRYVMTPSFRWQVSPGYFWNAYANDHAAPFLDPNFPADSVKNEYLTQVIPMSLQLQFAVSRGKWIYHAGAGPGLYRVWVQNRRKVLKDPDTFKLHRGIYPGASAEIGAERFLTALPNVSIQVVADGHIVFAERNEQFTSGFNSNLLGVGVRAGANYYFDLAGGKRAPDTPAEAPASP